MSGLFDLSIIGVLQKYPSRSGFVQHPIANEKIEYNEFLRGLEKGHKIRAVLVESAAISVDTEADLKVVRNQMLEDQLFQTYKNTV